MQRRTAMPSRSTSTPSIVLLDEAERQPPRKIMERTRTPWACAGILDRSWPLPFASGDGLAVQLLGAPEVFPSGLNLGAAYT